MNKPTIALISFSTGMLVAILSSKRIVEKKNNLLNLCGRLLDRYIDLAGEEINGQVWDEFAFDIVTYDMTPKDPRRKN